MEENDFLEYDQPIQFKTYIVSTLKKKGGKLVCECLTYKATGKACVHIIAVHYYRNSGPVRLYTG